MPITDVDIETKVEVNTFSTVVVHGFDTVTVQVSVASS